MCCSKQLSSLVIHLQKSLDTDLRLIAKDSFCLFDLLLYAPVNSDGHVEMSGRLNGSKAIKRNSTQYKSTPRDFRLCVTKP